VLVDGESIGAVAEYKFRTVTAGHTISATFAPSAIPVYRFYNTRSSSHFYTASLAEKLAIQSHPDWPYTYEGVSYHAYGAPGVGVTPLYRFYNWRTGAHFYTASLAEKLAVESHVGWPYVSEGIAYWVADGPAGHIPVYRFYNWRTGTHFYTADEAEKNNVLSHYYWPFSFDGTAFYALP
jgi:lysyl endopeptidase